MNNVDFLMDAAKLFKSYRKLYDLNGGNQEFYGIEGQYRLYCTLNGTEYENVFDIKIVYKSDMLIPDVYLPIKIFPKGFCHYYRSNHEYARCCLGLSYEILTEWGKDRRAEVFLQNIVEIYLINLMEFTNSGRYITGDWEHDAIGVLHYYCNLFNISSSKILVTLDAIMHKIEREKKFKGHQQCLCGSGKKLRNCHQKQFNKFIEGILIDKAQKQAFFNDMNIVKRELENEYKQTRI